MHKTQIAYSVAREDYLRALDSVESESDPYYDLDIDEKELVKIEEELEKKYNVAPLFSAMNAALRDLLEWGKDKALSIASEEQTQTLMFLFSEMDKSVVTREKVVNILMRLAD